MPPFRQALEKRLKRRRSESSKDLALRLATARKEMESLLIFDYVITSHQNKLDEVVSKIDSIVVAEKCRTKPHAVQL
jgi:guanylate kinase